MNTSRKERNWGIPVLQILCVEPVSLGFTWCMKHIQFLQTGNKATYLIIHPSRHRFVDVVWMAVGMAKPMDMVSHIAKVCKVPYKTHPFLSPAFKVYKEWFSSSDMKMLRIVNVLYMATLEGSIVTEPFVTSWISTWKRSDLTKIQQWKLEFGFPTCHPLTMRPGGATV